MGRKSTEKGLRRLEGTAAQPPSSKKTRLARPAFWLISAVALAIAFGLWQAMGTHPEILISGSNRLPEPALGPTVIGINVGFVNNGQWAVEYQHYAKHLFIAEDKTKNIATQLAYEDELHAAVLAERKTQASSSTSSLPQGSGQQSFTYRVPVSQTEHDQFFGDQVVLMVAGEFLYSDWLSRPVTTAFCYIFRAHAAVANCHRYNSQP